LLLIKKIALFHTRSRSIPGPDYRLLHIYRQTYRNSAGGVQGLHSDKMPRKKKLKRFRAVTAVKELARERVGAPPPEKIVIEKKKKPEKHKPTLGKLLEDL
jgi:hypothetical protein